MGYPSNRRERRELLFRSEHKQNNRKDNASQSTQLAPRYTQEEIDAASTSIERERRARAVKQIKHSTY